MNWDKIRGGLYALTAAVAMAAVTAIVALGWASYDAATGMLDIHPFHVGNVIAAVLSWLGTAVLALTALVKGWGRK